VIFARIHKHCRCTIIRGKLITSPGACQVCLDAADAYNHGPVGAYFYAEGREGPQAEAMAADIAERARAALPARKGRERWPIVGVVQDGALGLTAAGPELRREFGSPGRGPSPAIRRVVESQRRALETGGFRIISRLVRGA